MSGNPCSGLPKRYWLTRKEFAEWLDLRRRVGGVTRQKPTVRVKAESNIIRLFDAPQDHV